MSDNNGNSAHSFTAVEEEFFRVGSDPNELAQREAFTDLDEGYQRPSLLRRLFNRKATQQ